MPYSYGYGYGYDHGYGFDFGVGFGFGPLTHQVCIGISTTMFESTMHVSAHGCNLWQYTTLTMLL